MNTKVKFGILLLPLLTILVSLQLGATHHLSVKELWGYGVHYFSNAEESATPMETILWQVRLPRILLTFLVGAALATSGGVLQAIFRNPIVDPFTLGISSGAAFGAALAMLVPTLSLNFSAFFFGVCAVGITYAVSYSGQKTSLVGMVLSGIIVSGVFTALLTFLQYLSDPYKLQAIVQWTMGNLHTASWSKLHTAFYPILGGLLIVIALRWKLNILSLGDEEAKAVGVNPNLLKVILISTATLITAASVAAVGVISLFGLLVPHISRMLFGPNNAINVWANLSLGGTLLLLIDDFSRTLLPFEIPVGVFTMIIGAPVFIYLMRKNLMNWNI